MNSLCFTSLQNRLLATTFSSSPAFGWNSKAVRCTPHTILCSSSLFRMRCGLRCFRCYSDVRPPRPKKRSHKTAPRGAMREGSERNARRHVCTPHILHSSDMRPTCVLCLETCVLSLETEMWCLVITLVRLISCPPTNTRREVVMYSFNEVLTTYFCTKLHGHIMQKRAFIIDPSLGLPASLLQ